MAVRGLGQQGGGDGRLRDADPLVVPEAGRPVVAPGVAAVRRRTGEDHDRAQQREQQEHRAAQRQRRDDADQQRRDGRGQGQPGPPR